MKKMICLQCLVMSIIFALVFQPALLWAGDSWKEINDLAESDMKQIEEGIINVEKFCGEPWYKRHMGKLIAGGLITIGGIAFICTGGLAAPAVGAGAAHFAGTGAAITAGEAALAGATATAGAGLYVDSKGNIKIPDDKKWEVSRFYRDNYRSWVNRASSKKEFGEIAIKEIVAFLNRNK